MNQVSTPSIIRRELSSDSSARLRHLIVLFNFWRAKCADNFYQRKPVLHFLTCSFEKGNRHVRSSQASVLRAVQRWLLKAITSGSIASLLNGRKVTSHKKLPHFNSHRSKMSASFHWLSRLSHSRKGFISHLPMLKYLSKALEVYRKILLIESTKHCITYLNSTTALSSNRLTFSKPLSVIVKFKNCVSSTRWCWLYVL